MAFFYIKSSCHSRVICLDQKKKEQIEAISESVEQIKYFYWSI